MHRVACGALGNGEGVLNPASCKFGIIGRSVGGADCSRALTHDGYFAGCLVDGCDSGVGGRNRVGNLKFVGVSQSGEGVRLFADINLALVAAPENSCGLLHYVDCNSLHSACIGFCIPDVGFDGSFAESKFAEINACGFYFFYGGVALSFGVRAIGSIEYVACLGSADRSRGTNQVVFAALFAGNSDNGLVNNRTGLHFFICHLKILEANLSSIGESECF